MESRSIGSSFLTFLPGQRVCRWFVAIQPTLEQQKQRTELDEAFQTCRGMLAFRMIDSAFTPTLSADYAPPVGDDVHTALLLDSPSVRCPRLTRDGVERKRVILVHPQRVVEYFQS